MNELERNEVLHQLDRRHEELLDDLDHLNERIEQALAACGATARQPAESSA